MKAGDLDLLLNPILSLIANDGGQVRILHKSLFDYLLDATRSGHLPFDLARAHEVVATHILTQMIVPEICGASLPLNLDPILTRHPRQRFRES
jgi:hypothetical protein